MDYLNESTNALFSDMARSLNITVGDLQTLAYRVAEVQKARLRVDRAVYEAEKRIAKISAETSEKPITASIRRAEAF